MLKIDKEVLSLKRYIQCAVSTEDIELHYRESAISGFVLDVGPVDINSYVNKFDNVIGDPESQYVLFLKRHNISGKEYETVVFSDNLKYLINLSQRYLDTVSAEGWLSNSHRFANIADLYSNTEVFYEDAFEDGTAGWNE